MNWASIRNALALPSEENFQSLCHELSNLSEPALNEALSYVEQHLQEWPDTLRRFPVMKWKQLTEQPEDWLPFKLATTLDISNQRLGLKGAKLLAHSPTFQNIRILNAVTSKMTIKGLKELAKTETLLQLRELDIQKNNFGDEGLIELSRHPLNFRLRKLDYSWNDFSSTGILAMVDSSFAPELTSLTMVGNNLGLQETRSLCEVPLHSLEYLDIGFNSLTNKAFKHLAEHGQFPPLKGLHLSYNDVKKTTANILTQSEKFQSLETLYLYSMSLGDKAIITILEGLPYLKEVDLSWNDLTLKSWERLLDSPCLPGLEKLLYERSQLGDEGVEMLAKSERATSLKHLSLSYNGITDVGARWILESPVFANLEYINLSSNPLSEDMKAAIKERIPSSDFDYYPIIKPE